MVAVIVSGLLNPIFFIGFPLGIYWLRRSKKSHPLAAVDSGKPDSTVPCEEQEQPCTVNRTDDAMHWYHTTGGLLTILTTCICIGIIAAIFFGGPSQGPGIASTSSEVARPASNSVSDEDRQFIEGWKTKKNCNSPKENLQGIGPVCVVVSINGTLPQDNNLLIEAVRPDIELRLRQAGIKVVELPSAEAVLTVQVLAVPAPDETVSSWSTVTNVTEWTHIIRRGQHYGLWSTNWSYSHINIAGRSRFFDAFKRAITEQITSFLNEYLAANQP